MNAETEARPRPGRMASSAALLASLAIVGSVAAFGGRFLPGAWYAGLIKPSWTPPSWLFGPVWSLLYALMAVAAWLVWREQKCRAAAPALGCYLVHLVPNALWSWFFFGRQQIGAALLDLGALWVLALGTIVLFWRVRRLAAALLIPYLGWVSYAAFLNLALWRLNG